MIDNHPPGGGGGGSYGRRGVPLQADRDSNSKKVIEPSISIRLDKPTDRKANTFKKEDYDLVLKEYQTLKKMQLQGKEFDPVMQEIKTMFLSGRTSRDIIYIMRWFNKSTEEWTKNWTIRTVRMKLPVLLSEAKERPLNVNQRVGGVLSMKEFLENKLKGGNDVARS